MFRWFPWEQITKHGALPVQRREQTSQAVQRITDGIHHTIVLDEFSGASAHGVPCILSEILRYIPKLRRRHSDRSEWPFFRFGGGGSRCLTNQYFCHAAGHHLGSFARAHLV